MKDMLIEPKYKGIIFDLDGTLVNSLEDLIDSLNAMLDYYDLLPKTYTEGKQMIGRGLRNLVKQALPRKMFRNDDFVDKALAIMKSEYAKRYIRKTLPYEGIPDVLSFCSRHEIPIGVLTNKPTDAARFIVEHLFPDIQFVNVYGQEEGVRRKPDPTQTLKLAKEMGVSTDECLYMGDSDVDYNTAKNAGMLPVLCTYGFTPAEEIMKYDDAIWIKNPIRVIDALKYGMDMYRIFQERREDSIAEEKM